MLSFKPTFSLSTFTFIKRLFSSSSLSKWPSIVQFSGQTPKVNSQGKGLQSLFITVLFCFVSFFPDQVPSGLSEKLYILAFTNSCVIGQKWEKDKKFHPEVSHSASQLSDKKTRSCL